MSLGESERFNMRDRVLNDITGRLPIGQLDTPPGEVIGIRLHAGRMSAWRRAKRRIAVGARGAWERIEKYFSLPPIEKRLALNAALLVIAFRVGLWCLPYRVLRRSAEVGPRERARLADDDPAMRIASYVRAISRYVPMATCLTQALTVALLLRRGGLTPNLRIGAGRDEKGQFRAHARVECDGRIVIGDLPELASYGQLHNLRSRTVAGAA
jgi:hypothetical protein